MKYHLKHSFVSLLFASCVAAQVAVWGQCGGNGYTGSKSCASGNSCKYVNDWYSQCQPGAQADSSSAAPTTLQTSTAIPPTTVISSAPTASPSSGSTSCPAVVLSLGATVTGLPNPFQFANGAAVTSKAQWKCRQDEISKLMQQYELGTLPPKPSSVTGSLSGKTLTINVSEGGKLISFTATINAPSGGTAPYPAIIAYGAASVPVPASVATITFSNDDIAAQTDGTSRGKGKFYTIYGSGHSAGATTAWAWGVGRIIDALESTPSANIDTKRIGVTGCSRNGKGAMIAGALEPRIALTIPQESGSGGSACWRLSKYQQSQGQNVQTAPEIVGENVWFSKSFDANVNNLDKLPFDHHTLAGLIAPRGLIVIENTSMEWLGALSTYGCMLAARKQWEALGVPDNMGYSQVGNHNHCAFPSSQNPELTAFINKFLLNQSSANTNVFKTDGSFNFDQSKWAGWTVPKLA